MLTKTILQKLEGAHVNFLRQVARKQATRHRDVSWWKVTAEAVLQGSVKQWIRICGQLKGDSGIVGGHMSYFRCLCERDRLRGRVETPGAVAEAEGSG